MYSELVLASTSPARRALLTALGLPFRAETPGVEEVVPPGTSTRAAVTMLAERKARAVLGRWPTALVIGSDQLVDLDGQALGKPLDRGAARTQLESLSGRSHEILTGVCVVGPGFFACDVDAAQLTLFPLKADELDRYLRLGEWEGCAGGYRIEGRGQALFSAIAGDRTSVQGLPMPLLIRLLREAGVSFFH
ncbi:MAG: septum formation protein Maf [Archangiaceae bacterium]|nr:septum formation protein Maf [Archangiaceae bacterium]